MAASLCIVALCLLSLSTTDAGSARQGSMRTETDLRRDLFEGYDKLVRPVKDASTAVPLQVTLSPYSLKYLDVESQEIKFDSGVKMTWTDQYMQWNPQEYGNITEIRVPPTSIWTPDISLYTGTPDVSMFLPSLTQSIVYSNGMVLWVPPFTLNSRCPIQRSSPKDFITCNIRFGSWTYSGKMMDIQLGDKKIDMTNFLDLNRDWKLVKADASRESKRYDCCVEEYPLLHFNITFKRRSYEA